MRRSTLKSSKVYVLLYLSLLCCKLTAAVGTDSAPDPGLSWHRGTKNVRDETAGLGNVDEATIAGHDKPDKKILDGEPSFDATIAGQLHKVLDKEFDDNETSKGVASDGAGRSFDSTLRSGSGTLETVARITRSHDTILEKSTIHDDLPNPHHSIDAADVSSNRRSSVTTSKVRQDSILNQLLGVSKGIDKVMRTSTGELDDVERLIDSSDNEFVISNPKNGTMELQQDLRFIQDLVILLCAAALGSTFFSLLGQPPITGYLVFGSLVGPGGLGLVVELVQVETLAQFGIIFLLFSLGLEFSLDKLRHIKGVAILGGCAQIIIMMLFCGVASDVSGAGIRGGVFVGALLSMSSTAIVGKHIVQTGGLGSLTGQITMGTLILQDCCVGLLFALVPVLSESDGMQYGVLTFFHIVLKLFIFLSLIIVSSKVLVIKIFRFASSQETELFQMISVAFCLLISIASDQLGLSFELGAFLSGVMISTTPYADRTVESVEHMKNIFVALFMVSIGLIINPLFLWVHGDVLLGSLLVVVILKSCLVAFVVRAFGYSLMVSISVGVSLAQVGEFSFVLLSRASNVGLIERKLYLLLLGTTALSLVITPTMIRSIKHILNVGKRLHLLKFDALDMNPY